MVTFIFIITIVVLIFIINGKDNEIKKLKAKGNSTSSKDIRFCPNCGYDIINRRHNTGNPVINTNININNNINNNINSPVYVNNNINPVTVKTKPKYTDKEVKNSLILITGSVLVIISALLFLTTTWNITNSIIKTLLLVLMLIVFFVASHIADKILHLDQTAKAFRYIGLYFLPIVFFSISLFSLLGYNLSINGPNKYLYFFISSLIVTAIYYYSSVKNNSTLIKISTIIFSVITLIIGTLIFTNNSIIVMIVLSLYILLLNFLYTSNIYIFDTNIHNKTLATLLVAVFILSFNFLLFNCTSIDISHILLDIILFANIYYYLCKIINKEKVFANIYPIYIILLFLHLGGLFSGYLPIQLLSILSFAVIVIMELLIHKSISLGSYIEIISTSSLLYLITIIYRIIDSSIIEGYYFVIAISLASLIHYLSNKNSNEFIYKFSPYMFSSSLLFTIINIIIVHKLSVIFLGLASLIMSLIYMTNKNSDKLSKSCSIVGFIGFILSTVIMSYSNIFTSLLFLLFSLYNMLLFFKTDNKQYRYPSYIYYNLHLISLLLYFNKNLFLITNDLYLIIPLTTLFFVILEKVIHKLDDISNHIYILVQFILSVFLLVICEFTIPNMIIFIITSLAFIYYLYSIKYDEEWLFCPYLGIIAYLNYKFMPMEYSYFTNIFNFVSLSILVLFGYLVFYKKKIMYSILYYVNIFALTVAFNPNKYFILLLVAIGSIISYKAYENKEKDFFKAALLLCGLILARFIIDDFGLKTFTIINIGVYVLWVPLFTRLIIRKYSIDVCKATEYVANILINYMAFVNYTSEYDGLLFVLLLVLVVIVSYCIKLGPVFLVSIISILINILILTREFWLTIPWWIYVLIIGIILIGFAVYNEINAKKNKNNVIKELSKKIDL